MLITYSQVFDVILRFQDSFPHLYEFVVLNPSLYDEIIFSRFYASIYELIVSFLAFLHAISSVLYYLIIFILKVVFLCFPLLVSCSSAVIEFHRSQLGFWDIVVELLIITTALVFFLFRKGIYSAWKRLEENISRKSRTAARVAPHVLFFSASGLLAYFGNKFLLPLSSPRVLPFFTLVAPMYRTFQSVRMEKTSTYRDRLVTWIVLSLYFTCSTLSEIVPFSGILLRILPTLREFAMVVAVWVQASPVCADLVFEWTHPIIQYYVNQIPAADVGSSLGGVLTAMRFIGIPGSIVESIRGLLEDSGAVLISVMFMFMPFRIASVGVVIVAILLPAYKSGRTVVDLQPSNKPKKEKTSVVPVTAEGWLEYWFCLGMLMLFRSYGIATIWPSSFMALALWLQSSHFRGASVLRVKAQGFVRDMMLYERRRKEERACIKGKMEEVETKVEITLRDVHVSGCTTGGLEAHLNIEGNDTDGDCHAENMTLEVENSSKGASCLTGAEVLVQTYDIQTTDGKEPLTSEAKIVEREHAIENESIDRTNNSM